MPVTIAVTTDAERKDAILGFWRVTKAFLEVLLNTLNIGRVFQNHITLIPIALPVIKCSGQEEKPI